MDDAGLMKVCIACQRVLPEDMFQRNARGYNHACQDCMDHGLTPAQRRTSHTLSNAEYRRRQAHT